jgi:hypothetical protein
MTGFARTPALPEATPAGALSALLRRTLARLPMIALDPTEAYKAAVCYVRNTSKPAKLIGF